jgi:predicted cupin superfamily sugar epimerase
MDPAIRALIDELKLEPLAHEGGFFVETYRSTTRAGSRAIATAIYYLLTPESPSRLHRLRGDEIYHFYLGDPVELLLLFPDGTTGRTMLGPDLARGMRPQIVVPRGVWQGSCLASGGRYALLGTTMIPGFDPADFERGDGDLLVTTYPIEKERIRLLS